MSVDRDSPRAFFLSSNGESLPDTVVCSGLKLPELRGRACAYSDEGRFPMAQLPRDCESTPDPDKDTDASLTLPCAIMQLGSLGEWREVLGDHPPAMQDLCVFKCKQMRLFVVPGLLEDGAKRLEMEDPISTD